MTPNVFQRNVAILTLPLLITAIAAPGGNKAYQIRTEAVQKLRAPRPTIKLDGQFNPVFFLPFQWKMTITSQINVFFVCGRSQIDHVFFGVRFSA